MMRSGQRRGWRGITSAGRRSRRRSGQVHRVNSRVSSVELGQLQVVMGRNEPGRVGFGQRKRTGPD
jgi:hypothetical protein